MHEAIDDVNGGGTRDGARGVLSTVSEGPAMDDQVDALLGLLKPLVPAVARSLGRHCEVVLHDLRHPDGSIVAIAGNVTGRHVGGSFSQVGLSILEAGEAAQDQCNYVTSGANGRVIRSTTIVLRDPDGNCFGLLCINFDVTEMRALAAFLEDMTGSPDQVPKSVAFVDDVREVVAEVFREESAARGRPVARFDKQERLGILRALVGRGVFSIHRSVPQVAELLGVSRATVYADLNELRDESGEPVWVPGRSEGDKAGRRPTDTSKPLRVRM